MCCARDIIHRSEKSPPVMEPGGLFKCSISSAPAVGDCQGARFKSFSCHVLGEEVFYPGEQVDLVVQVPDAARLVRVGYGFDRVMIS